MRAVVKAAGSLRSRPVVTPTPVWRAVRAQRSISSALGGLPKAAPAAAPAPAACDCFSATAMERAFLNLGYDLPARTSGFGERERTARSHLRAEVAV